APEVVRTPKGMSRKLLLQRVVRRLSRDGDVVRMRLAQSRCRDADELSLRAKLLDVGAADVAHSTAQPAHHLEEHIAHRTFVRNSPLDSLRDEFFGGHLAFLEIPVSASVLHRGETSHAANHLEAATLEQKRLAGTLLGAGKHGSHHHARRASSERLDYIARVLDAAVGDNRYIACPLDGIEDRGELRNSDT